MILLVVIVQSEDVAKLSQRLIGDGFRFTRINATGGFLAAGNAVLLIGIEEDRLPDITAVIEATCHTRTRLLNAAPYPGMAGAYGMGAVAPVEAIVGGAVVFGLPVLRFLRLGGSPPPPIADVPSSDQLVTETAGVIPHGPATERMSNVMPASDPTADPEGTPPAATATRFVVAIVLKENADAVVNALMDGGYRLTRIDTAGGFLRRGNATLLIGVEASRLNDVLAVIQANCRPRSEPTPIEEGMPMYSATVFVLDASHFLRF